MKSNTSSNMLELYLLQSQQHFSPSKNDATCVQIQMCLTLQSIELCFHI